MDLESDSGRERDEERWSKEAEFFDLDEYSEGPIAPVTLQRYLDLEKPWLHAEYPFSLLGDVAGKRILEIGCGAGWSAIILGLKGARVHGIDISARAIQIASERAVLHNVADRVQFTRTPLETYVKSCPQESYDVIFGWAVLHHVLPVLDPVLADLKKLAHRDTIFLFSEPIAIWRWLRRLRLMLPIPINGTPNERPLNAGDLAIIRHHLPDMRLRYFGAFTRIASRLFPGDYELASPFVRCCHDFAAHLDNALLQVPGAGGLASSVTLFARARAD